MKGYLVLGYSQGLKGPPIGDLLIIKGNYNFKLVRSGIMRSLKYDVEVYNVTYIKLLPNEFNLNLNMRNSQKNLECGTFHNTTGLDS